MSERSGKPNGTKQRVQLMLSSALFDRLEVLASTHGLSVAEQARVFIVAGLVRNDPTTEHMARALAAAKYEPNALQVLVNPDEVDALNEAQRDGRACIKCGNESGPMLPAGWLEGCQVFVHAYCASERTRHLGALTLASERLELVRNIIDECRAGLCPIELDDAPEPLKDAIAAVERVREELAR